jgi:hypothetical protein
VTDASNETLAVPADAAGAQARKSELMANPEWRGKFLENDQAARTEMSALNRVIVGETSPQPDPVDPSQIEYARSLGIKDDVIAQLENKTPISQAEHDAVARLKAGLLKDQAFLKKLANGDYEARQKMTMANIALLSPIKQAS